MFKTDSYENKMQQLQFKIDDQQRFKSREGANVEYLKNVVYQYLVTREQTAKKRMAVAIATILQFSPDEKKNIGV